jgi:hypothetical protein
MAVEAASPSYGRRRRRRRNDWVVRHRSFLMSDLKIVIESDSPNCIFGYYGPYTTLQKAFNAYADLWTRDVTVTLVFRTGAQLEERIAAITARREKVKDQSS